MKERNELASSNRRTRTSWSRARGLAAALLACSALGCTEDTQNTIVQALAVSSVFPSAGPPAGGTTVSVYGAGFADGATVTFGATAAASVTFVSATELTVVTPAGTLGLVAVTVTNPGGGAASLGGGFKFALAPTLNTVSPDVGLPAGNTAVTLTGTGFLPGAVVDFGSQVVPATFLSTSTLTAVSPAGAPGSVTVTVLNPDGTTASLAPGFGYDTPPALSTSVVGTPIVFVGEDVELDVTATDPEGNPVNLRLINPPYGCVSVPRIGAASPANAAATWYADGMGGGLVHLVFEAEDATFPGQMTRLAIPVLVVGDVDRRAVLLDDVTGDGALDVVAGASAADAGGGLDTGAIYVWAGQTEALGDPTAVLLAPGSSTLGVAGGQGIQCADVNGDGIRDIVVGSSETNAPGNQDAGAIYVWAGGGALSGNLFPRPP